jgi:CheY-like chemotaxis protein
LPNKNAVKHKLLVVDDNIDDIEIVRIALESLRSDIEIVRAENGETALRILHNGGCCPDIVLLDLKLPGMNGFDVLRKIRSDDRLKDLPVFVTSSSVLDSDRYESIDAGATGYLPKSFDLDDFARDLNAVLNRWVPA